VSNNGKTSYYNNQRDREARRTKKEFQKSNPTGIKPSDNNDSDAEKIKSKGKKSGNKSNKSGGRKNKPIL